MVLVLPLLMALLLLLAPVMLAKAPPPRLVLVPRRPGLANALPVIEALGLVPCGPAAAAPGPAEAPATGATAAPTRWGTHHKTRPKNGKTAGVQRSTAEPSQ